MYRGSAVKLVADTRPEGGFVQFQWRAYACTDPTTDASGENRPADAEPFRTDFQASSTSRCRRSARVDRAGQAVLVLLEGSG